MTSPRTAELSLLLACAHIPAEPETIESLAQEVDWPAFVELARWHGVSPLVFHSLNKCGLGPEADEARTALQGDFQWNALNASRLSMELGSVVRFLEERGMPSVPFKGAALAASSYGNLWLRQFSDLDLLVRPEDALEAKRALAERGYRSDLPMSDRQEALLVRHSPFAYSFALFLEGGPMEIDLHWRFAESGHAAYPPRLRDPWSRLIETRIHSASVHTLGPEDELLLVSAHAAKHGWERLRWICDIAQVVSTHPDLDWDDVLAAVSEAGTIGERTLLTSLAIADAMFNLRLPAQIRARFESDRIVQRIAGEVLCGLGSTDEEWPLWWPRSFQSDAYFLRMADGLGARLAYLARFCIWRILAPDAKDRAAVALPGPLSFLYYLLRPARLLFEYGWGPLWQLLKLGPKVVRSS